MRFRLKMTVCMVWLLTLAYGLGGTLLITRAFDNALRREQTAALESYRTTVRTVRLVRTLGMRRDRTAVSATLERLRGTAAWCALYLTQDGEQLYGSGEVRAENAAFPEDGETCSVQLLHTQQGHYMQLSGRLGELTMEMVFDVSAPYVSRTQQLAFYRSGFLAALAAGALLAWAICYSLTRPLTRGTDAVRTLAEGDLSVRVAVESHDEVGQLAADFNQMAARLEQNVTELQESVQRQERFVGSFAHEMKTPMTSIIGYADLIRTQSLDEEETMSAANYIFSEGKRLESLSLKLLELQVMQNQMIRRTKTDVSGLIGSLLRHLRPVYADAHIRLQCRCEPGEAMLDADLVSSLLINLLDNAGKAMEQGGNICVVSDWTEGFCRIRVMDNGCGMPPEALRHITEAFYRVDKSRSRAQGGAGLGLALCEQIVRLHGGTLQFASRVGNGTCVTALLRRDGT